MGKVIFFAFVSFVVLTSLCFGYGDVLKTEAKPSLMYGNGFHNQPLTVLNNFQLQPLSFYASYKRPHFNSFITNALIMQAENETLQPKTSFWKQAGIYGLEFASGSGVSFLSFWYIARNLYATSFQEGAQPSDYFLLSGAYIVSGSLLPGLTVSQIGRLFNQNGSWVKASIGSGVGSIISLLVPFWCFTQFNLSGSEVLRFHILMATTLPPTLGVIGYNW
ncbi:MAG: hypothetical protein ABIL74_10445 [candidate division WOR-3 bacterium]